MLKFDVIVIGAGHAGIEAALAAARIGSKVLVCVLKKDTVGLMSCNPAIGGVGKGQLVREIDALGGEMAKAADFCGIQFRMLNISKGPAVHSPRAQIDMEMYKDYMRRVLQETKNITLQERKVNSVLVKNGSACGIITGTNEEIASKTIVVCPGTFLSGLIHVGLKHYSGGRINEPAATELADNLKDLGFRLLQFKTGTCPRLDKKTIDFSSLIVQEGDKQPEAFSFSTKGPHIKQVPCYITYTNKKTHGIISANLNRSPLYSGIIKSTGVRYCPSIEDKVVKFSDKDRHQIFLEPQGLSSDSIYPNGLSTSLPEDVQLDVLHSIAGLERVKILRFGYGIEHAVVEPTQLYPTLETKGVRGLYLAGQINGTTGYEEAAAQGLIAGINAALRIKNREPLVLDRSSSYIGVLIDDLTTKGTNEPYRMFTSRVEYRLIVRQDNADLRLSKIGYNLGLISKERYRRIEEKTEAIRRGLKFFKETKVRPCGKINSLLQKLNTPSLCRVASLEDILKRPQLSMKDLEGLDVFQLHLSSDVARQVEIELKYSGFIKRQFKEVGRFKNLENIKLPADLDYSSLLALSREIRDKLSRFRPLNLGQASRISGVTPAAISLLMVYLRKINAKEN